MVGQNILEHEKSSCYEFLTPASRELDLTNQQALDSYLSKHYPDIIIHCAGLVGGIQANISQPVNFLVSNTLMGVNLVSAAYRHKIPNLLNIASSCMYPRDAKNPLCEDQLLSGRFEPTNEGYALAKIATTRLCEYVCKEDPVFNYRSLIPCNLYGRFDHFESSRSHLIPAIVQKIDDAIVTAKPSVEIWGDGLARREFMYAADLADFIFFVIPLLNTLPNNLNVGLGTDYSINDYYQTAASLMDFTGEFVHDLSKPIGMNQKLMDITLQKKLGWSPKTSLESGLRETIEFYRKEKC